MMFDTQALPKKAKISIVVGMHKESRMTLEKYEQLLKAHDWFYHMSDDHRYYDRGRKQSVELRLALTELENQGLYEEAKELFNEISPTGFEIK